MLLRVENLGPVREAELDLGKPLIVLTGPNNSGKTYLAWAAYSLARLDGNKVEPPTSMHAWADRLLDAKDHSLGLDTLLEHRDDVLASVAEAMRMQVPEDFAAGRTRFESTRFALLASAADNSMFRERAGGIGTNSGSHSLDLFIRDLKARLRIKVSSEEGADFPTIRVKDLSAEELTATRLGIARLASQLLAHHFRERRHVVLPVERLAINLFARELAAKRTELVDELLNDASNDDASTLLRDKLQHRAGRYPLVIRDALQAAIRATGRADIGPLADLAEDLEASVLGGTIKFDEHEDLKFISHQDSKKAPLGLHESASVVKSLVSLVLYLRYRANRGQRLVIDEPELNLHPDNQRRITRILAKAVNRGLKIMMSTHSDYVIRELNNLVMLGHDSDEARALQQELGYQPEQTLRPEQIGAYLVNDGECKQLEVTETGFESKTIEDEIHKLNHDAQTIYLRLFCD